MWSFLKRKNSVDIPAQSGDSFSIQTKGGKILYHFRFDHDVTIKQVKFKAGKYIGCKYLIDNEWYIGCENMDDLDMNNCNDCLERYACLTSRRR